MKDIKAKRLRDCLDYNPDTGLFTWLVTNSNRSKAGTVAGYISKSDNYRYIRIDGMRFNSARLVWLYCHGRWPIGEVDHKNCVRSDDRIDNLREATRGQNESNKKPKRNNTSGCKGVSWHSTRLRWQAEIQANGKKRFLGYFRDKESAVIAYQGAVGEYHGEFARLQ